MSAVPHNFLGLEQRYSTYAASDFVILPVPYDATTSFMGGTRAGPQAVIGASAQVELFDHELGGEFFKAGVFTADALVPNVDGPEAMQLDIYRCARRIVYDGKFLLALGGEHSITSALVKAQKTRYKKISVLQVDAHADLRQTYEGSRYSHACVMRRIFDMGVPFCGVGIRNYCAEEHRFMKRHKIQPITAVQCLTEENWIDRVLDALSEIVYVSIDVDAFDPSQAPGTGTPEPGGLDWFQVNDLLRAVSVEKRIIGADIVEVIPVPGQVVTEFLAAKLAYKIISNVQCGAA